MRNASAMVVLFATFSPIGAPLHAVRQQPTTPVIKANPAVVRLSGRVASVDVNKAVLVIRDFSGARRTFNVARAARRMLSTLVPADNVIVTWRKNDLTRTVSHIEVAAN